MPVWDNIVQTLEGKKLNVVKRSCVKYSDYCAKITRIKGYPTLFFITPEGDVTEYTSIMTHDNIVNFVEKMIQ